MAVVLQPGGARIPMESGSGGGGFSSTELKQ